MQISIPGHSPPGSFEEELSTNTPFECRLSTGRFICAGCLRKLARSFAVIAAMMYRQALLGFTDLRIVLSCGGVIFHLRRRSRVCLVS